MAKTLLSMQDLQARARRKSGSNPAVQTSATSQSITSRMSTVRIIGPYVCCPQGLLMPTPRLAPHSMSKAFCAAIMI